MASLVKRNGTPFWYAQVKKGGRWVRVRTKFLVQSSAQTRKAHEYVARLSREEKTQRGSVDEMAWDRWVEPFFNIRYGTRPLTLGRFLGAWKSLRIYLKERGIRTPAELRRQDCIGYVTWRTEAKHVGIYRARRNTALFEVKLLGLLVGEALNREWVSSNPCRGLGIPREPSKLKPEISFEEEAIIRKALVKEPHWMQVSFEISMATGARLSETSVGWEDVDLEKGQITFTQKGNRTHTTLLPPRVIPFLRAAKEISPARTLVFPKSRAKWWHQFFRRIGLGHLSYHSTRVSVVSRLARAGISERLSMRYVGHASATVHRIYARLAPSDLGACASVLNEALLRLTVVGTHDDQAATRSSG